MISDTLSGLSVPKPKPAAARRRSGGALDRVGAGVPAGRAQASRGARGGRRGVGPRPLRPVRDPRAHRPRRHGRAVQGAAHRRRGLPEDRRDQEDPAAPRGRREFIDDVRRRGEARRAAEPPQHRPHLRPRQDQADGYFIAMEYVDGRDLRAILSRRAARSVPMPARAGASASRRKVASALDYAHRKRDAEGSDARHRPPRRLAAEHAHLATRATSSSCDFGIAKAATKASQTQAGALKGKFQYMSPGAGVGPADRPPQRHLLARARALRDADRAEALHGRQRHHRFSRRCARARGHGAVEVSTPRCRRISTPSS